MERTGRLEKIQRKFSCTIFKVVIIMRHLTRGPSLMKRYIFFSHPPLSSPLASSLSLCRLSSISLFVHFSPRWIIAQRTVRQTQVQIMSLRREHCCLNQERPLKVKMTVILIRYGIFKTKYIPRLRLKQQRSSAEPFPLSVTKI